VAKYKSHSMHRNSLLSWEQFESGSRRQEIARAIAAASETVTSVTDRVIADGLGYKDMNKVRPTITSMIQKGHVVECGAVVCDTTGRLVRSIRMATRFEFERFKPASITSACSGVKWNQLCSSLGEDPDAASPLAIANFIEDCRILTRRINDYSHLLIGMGGIPRKIAEVSASLKEGFTP